jgi:tryptophan synthase alpha chain
MNNINKQLNKIKKSKKLGFMTHIVIGYPNLEESKRLVIEMADSGVDFVELQIPFSDPMADGPTIMQANKVALDNGITVDNAFDLMSKLTAKIKIPLLFMTYFNIVFNYGVEQFCKDAQQAGAAGLIIPDIPIEEEINEKFLKYCQKYNLIAVRLLSPVSTVDRIKKNSKIADGFVYFISRKGITGSKTELDKDLSKNISTLKKYIKNPIAVGFGISKIEHIQVLKKYADIAVIGSEIINVYNNAKKDKIKAVGDFLRKMKNYS